MTRHALFIDMILIDNQIKIKNELQKMPLKHAINRQNRGDFKKCGVTFFIFGQAFFVYLFLMKGKD